jgi:hypothetical protein
MRHTLLLIFVVFLFSRCGNRQEVRAKVFERKEIESNRLIIKYGYQVNGKTFTDSAVIKNVVIGGDSINVIIDPDNPEKGLPDLK